MPAQGWYRDPSGAHEDRWFSAGRPTPLVRDGGTVSREDLPFDQQPGVPPDPLDHAAIAARDKIMASRYLYPYWSVVLRCAIVFIAAGLFVAWSVVSRPTHGFELARSAVAWVQADRAVQVTACLAAATLLLVLTRRRSWRPVGIPTVWGIALLQIGSFLLSGSQYPGNSCWAQPEWTSITLRDSLPPPEVTTTPGAHIVVTVPAYSPSAGVASNVTAATDGILREECTISLPGSGRRAIFAAIKPGTTEVFSEGSPSPAFTPFWFGKIIVRRAGTNLAAQRQRARSPRRR